MKLAEFANLAVAQTKATFFSGMAILLFVFFDTTFAKETAQLTHILSEEYGSKLSICIKVV